MKLVLRSDGASRGNPGPAALGVVLEDASGRVLREVSEAIGIATNNVAEYRAVLRGLEEAKRLGAQEVEIRTDSELVARQLGGRYRVRDHELRRWFEAVQRRMRSFREVQVRSVPRSENARADRLARLALSGVAGPVEEVVRHARAGRVEQARRALQDLSAEQARLAAQRLVEELARLRRAALPTREKMEAGAGRAAAPPAGGEESPGSRGQGGG